MKSYNTFRSVLGFLQACIPHLERIPHRRWVTNILHLCEQPGCGVIYVKKMHRSVPESIAKSYDFKRRAAAGVSQTTIP